MNNQSKLGETQQDDHQPSKRQELDEDNAQMIEAKKIIDLNEDCLVEIFKHLNLRDLFNVAVSNGLFVEAARSVYRRKFGTKLVYVSCVRTHPRPPDRDYSDRFTYIYYHIFIEDLKTCLQFVRCFGSSINEIKICYNGTTFDWQDHIDHYVNKYCAGSLVNISYSNKPMFSMKNFQNPFTKVERVQIEGSNSDRNLPSFAEWFPNLRRLELHEIRIDRSFTRATFQQQHLEHLSIKINNRGRGIDFSNENAAHLLGLHPQLQSLNIRFERNEVITLTRLMNIIKNNPSITKLVFDDWFLPGSRHRANATELIEFANEHPALVELDFRPFEISADDVIALVGQLKSLKKFRFHEVGGVNSSNYLMEHLGNEWIITFGAEWSWFYVELKRKD